MHFYAKLINVILKLSSVENVYDVYSKNQDSE